MQDVAFFSDRHMLPGLHVTILSLLNALSEGEGNNIRLHVFFDRVGRKERDLLARTHALNPKGTKLELHDFSPAAPPGGNALHGNQTTYGRLYLADLLPDSELCVYLDSDLIVNRSISHLFAEFDGDHMLLADVHERRRESLDHELFRKAGLDMEGDSFNCGVLGVNLRLWRVRKGMQRCQEAAEQYPGHFLSADQALLNLVFHDSLKPVGRAWNTPLYPTSKKVMEMEPCIYHFVGSPKPWDLLGRQLTNNYHLWWSFYSQSAARGRAYLMYASVWRSMVILRRAFQLWKKKRQVNRAD